LIFAFPDVGGVLAFTIAIKVKIEIKISTTSWTNGRLRCLHRPA
jgi:hypothetical protein